MFCKRCGSDIGQNIVCPYCGQTQDVQPMGYQQSVPNGQPMGYQQSVPNGQPMGYQQGVPIAPPKVAPKPPAPPKPPKNKSAGRRNKAVVGVLVGVVLVLIAACVFLLINLKNSSLQKDFDDSYNQITVDAIPIYLTQAEEYKAQWDKTTFISLPQKNELVNNIQELAELSEAGVATLEAAAATIATYDPETYKVADTEAYQNLVTAIDTANTAVEEKDIENVEALVADIDAKIVTVCDDNETYVNNMLAQYAGADYTTAATEDMETYNNSVGQIDEYLAEGDYQTVATLLADVEGVYNKYVQPEHQIILEVQQIDVIEYPNVKIYLDITDESSTVVEGLIKESFYVRKKNDAGQYISQVVHYASQLNQSEALNINMVADVSGSMEGDRINTAKSIMTSFVNSVQFEVGDMVELTAFSDGVFIKQPFTSDANDLIAGINSLYTENMTALYDALYTSVNKVASRPGAKCVIAFTDGLDNYSSCTPQDVIDLANRYHVPVFIIGIGYEDYSSVSYIAEQTGGCYYNAESIDDMGVIYEQIYRQEKEMYVVEFEDSSNVDLFSESSIVVGYHTVEYGGETPYSYVPNTLVSVNDNSLYTSGPEGVVASYMVGFADAMTMRDYSYIAPYILPGSSIEQIQQSYVLKGIDETLDSYEIESVEYTSADSCIVTTRETYFVQPSGKPLSLLTQRCKYVVVQTGGEWKMTDFAENVQVLSNIKY